MDNKLIIQLLRSKTEEINSLLEHFQNHPSELYSKIDLLEDRIKSLSKDFNFLQKNITEDSTKSEISNKKTQAFQEKFEIENSSISIDKTDLLKEQEAKNQDLAHNPTLNDQLKSDCSDDLRQKFTTYHLADIQSAIGINDRFLFIREIFDNNEEEYNSTIAYLNQSTNLETVLNWINKEKNWDIEDPTVKLFIEIIKRKF